MTTPSSNAKAALREQIRARLKNIPATVRVTISAQICQRLRENEVWSKACSVLFFAPMASEPDVWPLLAEALQTGKLVALPRFDPEKKNYAACEIRNLAEDLVSGKFGIREPHNSCPTLPLNRLDLILVPGVAFDLHGRRLGRGKGFYDQLLADVRGTTCGMAFDEQIVADIPMEPHDIPLNCILTPTRWIKP